MGQSALGVLHVRFFQPVNQLATFSSCGARKISLSRSKAPTTMALSAMLKAGQ